MKNNNLETLWALTHTRAKHFKPNIKNDNGVSMISLVITIVVILILAAISFATSTRVIGEADYSKYANNVSEVATFFEKTSVNMHNSDLAKELTLRDEQIYNFVAKAGETEADFLFLRAIPAYTIIAENANIGMELPILKVESGTGKMIPIKYATTKHGKIFTWPPYDYKEKYYVTDSDTVKDKMQTEITVGDENFTIVIDSTDGSLMDAPIIELPPVTPGEPPIEEPTPEIPKEDILEHTHDFSSKTATDLYLSTRATCKTLATYYYKCTGCAEKGTATYTYGSLAAHSYGNWIEDQSATCSQVSKKHRTCTSCGLIDESIGALDTGNHVNIQINVITEAGCVTAGLQEKYCSACDKVLEEEIIDSLGHKFSGATCTENGKCSRCGELSSALGHDWNSAKPKVCNRCGLVSADDESNQENSELNPDDGTTPDDGDVYEAGNYEYRYNQYYYVSDWKEDTAQNGWGVRCVNNVADPGPIMESINGEAVTCLYGTFMTRSALAVVPEIPSSVNNMFGTFWGCSSITSIDDVIIPSGVTSLDATFYMCTSLTDVSNFNIPDTVTSMYSTFQSCTSLTVSPRIPTGIINLGQTFRACKSLRESPNLNECSQLTEVGWMFYGCTSLETAPIISSNITEIDNMFYECTSLKGTITINTTPDWYGNCFTNVDMSKITLAGTCDKKVKQYIANTGLNSDKVTIID